MGYEHWCLDSYTIYDHSYQFTGHKEKLAKGGYTIFSNYAVLSEKQWENCKLKILLIGGSTTSVILGSTWGKRLYELLKEHRDDVCILNGGCGSFNSFCEYMKLQRDITTIKPTHVISLSGVNDSIVGTDISHGFFSRLVNPLTRGELFDHYNSPIYLGTRADRWIEEAKHMKGLCDLYEINFRRYLQPAVGIGSSSLQDLKSPLRDMVEDAIEIIGQNYLQRLNDFYSDVKSLTLEDYIHDITECLEDESDHWSDARHPSDMGYSIISKIVYDELIESL